MGNAKPRVIVADDHPAMLDAVSHLLQRNDYTVIAAVEDGEKAVQSVSALDPDVVVLDISMPRMDGLAAGHAIRRSKPNSRLLFLTIQSDAEYVEAARALGAGYVLKSRLYSDLLPAVAELLAKESPAQTVAV